MKKEICGKTYVQVKAEQDWSCTGCAAQRDDGLCEKLHTNEYWEFTPDICTSVNEIFKEQTMSEQKTVVELMDDAMCAVGRYLCGDDIPKISVSGIVTALENIKSAIERERQQAVDDWAAKSVELVQSEKLREIEKLLSAKRETEMKETIGNLESKVKSHTQTIREMNDRLKSAIVMRPISELPDKVPDGCAIVMIKSGGVWWTRGAGTPKDGAWEDYATHFYIIPYAPKPDRRLHPCYMPGCRKEVVTVQASIDGYFVSCSCGASGPVKDTEEAAKQAWGYAE